MVETSCFTIEQAASPRLIVHPNCCSTSVVALFGQALELEWTKSKLKENIRRIDFPCHIYIIEPNIKQIGQNAVKQKNSYKKPTRKTVVKRAQTTRKTGRKIKLKTTGNELEECDAMKQSKQFPFCHRRPIFLSLVPPQSLPPVPIVILRMDCHHGWLLSLGHWVTIRTILIIVPWSFCNSKNL